MGKELIIHLGLPKTGTTTLQNRIFQYHPEYLYLGKYNPDYTEKASDKDTWSLPLRRNLVSKDLPYFEDFNFGQLLQGQFADYERFDKYFWSEENIFSRCMTPGLYGNLVRIGSAYNILDKLKILLADDVFSPVKLILVVRKQDELIESFFAEQYHSFKSFFGMKTPEEFIAYLLGDTQLEEIDSLLRYASLVKHLDSLFGQENVLVIPYEKMKMDPKGFLTDLSSFMQIKRWENIHLLKKKRDNNRDAGNRQGKLAKTRSLRRKLSGVKRKIIGDVPTGLGNSLKFVDKFQKRTIIRLSESQKQKIFQAYESENKMLQLRVKSLSEYGYC